MAHKSENNINEALQFAIEKHNEGDLVAALGIYDRLLKIQPYNGNVLHLMALTALRFGNSQLANTLQLRAFFTGLQPPPDYTLLSDAYQRMDITPQALEQHANAAAIYEALQLSMKLLDKNLPEGAQAAAMRAKELFPESPDIEEHFGKILWSMGRFDEAKASHLKALMLRKINHNSREILLLPVIGMKEYCRRHGCKYITIEEERAYIPKKPEIINQKPPNQTEVKKIPELYISELNNITIMGENPSLIVNNEFCIFDMAVHQDSYRLELTAGNMKHCGDGCTLVDIPPLNTAVVEKGVMLSGGSAGWGHWLFEVLPRFYILDLFKEYKDIPLLIDEAAVRDPHIVETLKIANVNNREIVLLKKGQRYLCKTLVYPSKLVHIPQELKAWTHIDVGDDLISPLAIRYLRNKLFRPEKYKSNNKKRLYIPRFKGNYRRLLNEADIWPIFESHGFVMVQPDKLEFEEKLKLFMDAEIIGGVGSSGFINHIFSPADTVMFHIISDPWRNSCFFPNICSVTGQKTFFLFGKPHAGTHVRDYHCDFYINPEEVKEALKALNALVQKNRRNNSTAFENQTSRFQL